MSVKFSVVEGINADVNADFSISSALDISSQTAVKKTLAVTTNHILIYSDSAVYFRFDLSSTTDTINTSNDLILPASTLISLRVPNGLAPEDGGPHFELEWGYRALFDAKTCPQGVRLDSLSPMRIVQ